MKSNRFLVKANYVLVTDRWLMQLQYDIALYKTTLYDHNDKSTNALILNGWS